MTWIFFLLAVIFVFVGIGGSLYSAGKAMTAHRLSQSGTLTEATVVRVDVEEIRTRENDMDVFKKRYREVVAYQNASGEKFETRLTVKAEGEPRLSVGDRVEIRYDPENPASAVEAHGSRAFRDAVAGSVFGIVFALAALFLAMKTGVSLTHIHSNVVVLAVALLLAALLFGLLWSMRGTIALHLPAATPGEVIRSGGIAVTLPDMKPFTGRLREDAGERTTITTFEEGRVVAKRIYVRGKLVEKK